MKWTELTIYTSHQGLELLSDKLFDLGVSGFVVEDPSEIELFIKENSDGWDMIDEKFTDLSGMIPNIKVYIPDNEQGRALEGAIASMVIGLKADMPDVYGDLSFDTCIAYDEDWENSWKVFFKPVKIGDRLIVKPSWEAVENDEGRILIEIDPANSFGSGQHETTKLCLKALEEYVKDGMTLIDVGTGSGILSAAALLLGAAKAIAVDIDETAVETAKETLKKNGVLAKADIRLGDLVKDIDEKADILVANLFAAGVKRLACDASRVLKRDGLFIASGIITDSLAEVTESFESNHIDVIKTENIGGWHMLVGRI